MGETELIAALKQGGPWAVVLGVMWIPAVPFMASDVWRLLMPLTNGRGARLRLAFALASGLGVLVPATGVHRFVWPAFKYLLAPTGLL